MRTSRETFGRACAWTAAVGVAAALFFPVAAAAAERGRTVYYQVTYADGRVRELSRVPTTDRGIQRVLRITRVEQGTKGYEILSTGPQPLTLVSRGQTYKCDLQWNGEAWVAPAEAAPVPPKPHWLGARPDAAQRADDLRLRATLLDLARKLTESHAALMEVEQSLGKAGRGAAGRKRAAAAVAKARKDIRACVAAILESDKKLSAAAAVPPAKPTGKVTLSAPAAAKGAHGIRKPIDTVAVLPHRVQVRKLPPGDGRRTIRASIAHPEAGALGGFYYVAYADTDGDGRPDRLIARSPLAEAPRAGAWTQWQFNTDRRHVFVGKALVRPETSHYHVEAIRVDDNWRGLPREVYVAADTWGLPVRRWGPCLGNIRVWVTQP